MQTSWSNGISGSNSLADLFLRFSSTHQSEMAATVYFAAGELGAGATEEQVLQAVMDWKQRRKPPFDETEVALTIRNLAVLGWIKVKASDRLPLPLDQEFVF